MILSCGYCEPKGAPHPACPIHNRGRVLELSGDERMLSELGGDFSDLTGCFGAALWGLYGMAVGLDAQEIFEVGVGKGGSTRALLLAAGRTDGLVRSVDVLDRTEVVPPALRYRWQMIVSRSQDLPSWPDSIDLLFLDGDHDYEPVAWELAYLGAAVRRGGLIVMDDCWPMFPGALRAFEEYDDCAVKWLLPYGVPEAQPGGRDRTMGVIRR